MRMQQEVRESVQPDTRLDELRRIVNRLNARNSFGAGVLWIVTALVAIMFVGIIIYLLLQGSRYLFLPEFYGTSDTGVGKEIFNTFYILILAEIFSLPIALGGRYLPG